MGYLVTTIAFAAEVQIQIAEQKSRESRKNISIMRTSIKKILKFLLYFAIVALVCRISLG